MDYKEAIKYIQNTLKFGSKLGLDNIRELMVKLGNPQDSLNIIHVAGTNGKGSTCVMISEILKSYGMKVGLYTSPYIHEFAERIKIDGKNIEKSELGNIVSVIKEAVDDMCRTGLDHPTEFEIVTAAAFLYFSKMKCDIVVLEVGLGGRFDATNIIKNPLISVITSISKDHTKQLGNTIDKIAFEKCGIIKENSNVVVYGKQEKLAFETIRMISKEKSSTMQVVDNNEVNIISENIKGINFSYKNCKDIKINMVGTYQAYNAATAIETIFVLNEILNININCKCIKDGLLKVSWPGRFEIFEKEPVVIMDGAHNLEAVKSLKESLQKYVSGKRIILLLSFMKDKEYEECIKELCPIADFIVATSPKLERALDSNKLRQTVLKYNNNCVEVKDSFNGYLYALKNAAPEDVICCCGSFYLISEIRDKVRKSGRNI